MQELEAVGKPQAVDHAPHVDGAAADGQAVGLAVTGHDQDSRLRLEQQLAAPVQQACLVVKEAVADLDA